MTNRFSKQEKIIVCLIILLVAIITVSFGNRKVDYYIDELWTYGLANNIDSTQPNIEFGREYSGMGPYETFMEVQSGEGFNYVNVWKNQANDVHPPLYYVFIHTICSIFSNSFSKWYGIALNLFWMIGISILLYMLSKEITGSVQASAGIVLAYETSVIFMNTLLFIRMYAQVTFFVIAFACLFKKYWNKTLDKKFFGWFAAIVVLGMMTHYYFLIIAFALCAALAMQLAIEKRFLELRNVVLVAIGSGALFLLCWYHFLGHLFRGYRGKEAISSALSFGGLIEGTSKMFSIINQEAFAGVMIVFLLVIVALVVIRLKNKEKIWGYESALFLGAIFYVLVVGKIAPYRDDRYLMPVMFELFITAYIAVQELLKLVWNGKMAEYVTIAIFLVVNFANIVLQGGYVKMDFYREDKNELMNNMEDKCCIVFIQDPWEALYYYTALQHAKSYIFVNSFILASTPREVKSIVETLGATELYYHGQDAYYWVEK